VSRYIDSDGDSTICQKDLVTSLHIPPLAAQSILCRVMGVHPPMVGSTRPFACPELTPDALYTRLGQGSLELKRLVVASSTHWIYYNRGSGGQSYRCVGGHSLVWD
jgi:hypothetical protein